MNWLLRNFWLKVVAFGLAFLVWLHVKTDKTYNHEVTLPVTDVILNEGLALASPPPDSLRVSVAATGKQLLRRKWRQQGVRINAHQYRAGRFNMALTTQNTSMVYQAADVVLDDIIAPVMVRLEIDALDSVLLPVVPELEAEADEGFAAGREHAVEPATVLLVGPRSHLTGIENLRTVSRKLTSLRNPVTITLPVAAPDGYGFRIEPDSVVVTVPVSPVKTRVFNRVPIQVFNAPGDTRPRAEPADLQVELTGPPGDVDQLDRQALTLSVDFREVGSDGRVAVKFDCPPGFKLKALSSDTVTIIDMPHANPGD